MMYVYSNNFTRMVCFYGTVVKYVIQLVIIIVTEVKISDNSTLKLF